MIKKLIFFWKIGQTLSFLNCFDSSLTFWVGVELGDRRWGGVGWGGVGWGLGFGVGWGGVWGLGWGNIILSNRLIYGTYCLPCFALLVLLVAATKIHWEEQTLITATKQSSQSDRQAGWQGSWACQICFGPACLVLWPLPAFTLQSGFCTN
jgi:hypothetical protein